MLEIKSIQEIAYHRNGISGIPFYFVRFTANNANANANFLATVFANSDEDRGYCAVICLDMIESHGIAFGRNSWRGDDFEPELRAAIKQWESARSSLECNVR